VTLFQKLLDEYLQIVGIIDTITEKENIDLIKRLLRIQNPKWVGTIFKAVRVQGIFTKLLVEKSLFEIEKDSLHFNNIFGEKIIQIKEGSDRIKILIDALNTNTEELSNVIYLTKEKKFIIKVKKRFVGKIFGLKGINIQSAEKITNYKIEVEIE
jgi:transcription antitermination factor NusA-like protein